MIKQVIFNLSLQNKMAVDKAVRPFYNLAIFKIGIGVFLDIISAILIPDQIILPIGLVASGIIAAMVTKKQML